MVSNKFILTTVAGFLITNLTTVQADTLQNKKYHHNHRHISTSSTYSSYKQKQKKFQDGKQLRQVEEVNTTNAVSTVDYHPLIPPHFYLGLNVGVSNSHNYAKADPAPGWSSLVDLSTQGNLAAGGFIGYEFSPIFATELGFTHYTGARLRDTVQQGSNIHYGNQRIPSQAVDLLARVNVPLGNHSELYIKGGPAWVTQSSASEDINIGGTTTSVDIIKKANQVVPEAGVGVAFFSERTGKFQIGYNRLFGLNDIASIDYVYAAVTYPLNI